MKDKQNRLTQTQRKILKAIDQILDDGTIANLQLSAKQIAKLWNEEHTTFQSQLIMRAVRWQRIYTKTLDQYSKVSTDEVTALLKLIHVPGVDPPLIDNGQRSKQVRRPVVVPSISNRTPKTKICAEEMERFQLLIENESFIDIFDHGNSILRDKLFRPSLIRLGDQAVMYDQVWPWYQHGLVQRPWDSEERSPEIALALDYVLLIILIETKWTWMVCEKYLMRLPWGHPMKTTVQGRPGWKVSISLLSSMSLIQLRSGQTWELTESGRQVSIDLKEYWKNPTQ